MKKDRRGAFVGIGMVWIGVASFFFLACEQPPTAFLDSQKGNKLAQCQTKGECISCSTPEGPLSSCSSDETGSLPFASRSGSDCPGTGQKTEGGILK